MLCIWLYFVLKTIDNFKIETFSCLAFLNIEKLPMVALKCMHSCTYCSQKQILKLPIVFNKKPFDKINVVFFKSGLTNNLVLAELCKD